MFVALRVRSLKRCAPKSARRLMWSGLRLLHGFSAGSVAVACCLRKRSHGVSSETSVASYIWTAMPKNSAKLYCINEYSFVAAVAGSALTLVLRNQRLRTVRIHANDLARPPPLLVECGLDHLVIAIEVEALLGPPAHRSQDAVGRGDLLLRQGPNRRELLALLALTLGERASDLLRRAAGRRHLDVADDRRHGLGREAGVQQRDAHLRAVADGSSARKTLAAGSRSPR